MRGVTFGLAIATTATLMAGTVPAAFAETRIEVHEAGIHQLVCKPNLMQAGYALADRLDCVRRTVVPQYAQEALHSVIARVKIASSGQTYSAGHCFHLQN